jgi:hypothetical protein
MTIFEHLDSIEKMVEQAKQDIGNYAMLATGSGMENAFSKGFAGGAGTLHSNVFGNMYSGSSPFSVGKINSHGASGAMHSDVFGNLRVGDSPFVVGHINSHGQAGEVHSDVFGQVRVGDSPFVSGNL